MAYQLKSEILRGDPEVTLYNNTGSIRAIELKAEQIVTLVLLIPVGIFRFCCCAFFNEEQMAGLQISGCRFETNTVVRRLRNNDRNIFELLESNTVSLEVLLQISLQQVPSERMLDPLARVPIHWVGMWKEVWFTKATYGPDQRIYGNERFLSCSEGKGLGSKF